MLDDGRTKGQFSITISKGKPYAAARPTLRSQTERPARCVMRQEGGRRNLDGDRLDSVAVQSMAVAMRCGVGSPVILVWTEQTSHLGRTQWVRCDG